VNVEIAKDEKEGATCTRCSPSQILSDKTWEGKGKLAKARASEVGNVFDLGQKYGKDFDMGFTGRDGTKQYPVMGCYGIGISRLMGVIVEKYNDEKGILWPESVAPFQVHLLALNGVDGNAAYEAFQKAGIEVLYDDRDATAGTKFAEADLIGIPWRAVVSPKTEGKIELKRRNEEKAELLSIEEVVKKVSGK
jgi:prolyl-tRNA synthetase